VGCCALFVAADEAEGADVVCQVEFGRPAVSVVGAFPSGQQ